MTGATRTFWATRAMVAAFVPRPVRWSVAACALLCAHGLAGLPGEDPLATKDAIGRGVHAFHGGDFDRAYDEFTTAIEAGTEDPRAFYYRGLAALRLGRAGEAEADFTAGADREANDGSTKRVSRSLERVQGCDRLTLERYRARARLASLRRDNEAAARRYSTIEDPSSDLRRRRRPEDVGAELVAPRRDDAVEEVPAPRGKASRDLGDEEQSMPEDADEESTESVMADEADEEMTEDDSQEESTADGEQ